MFKVPSSKSLSAQPSSLNAQPSSPLGGTEEGFLFLLPYIPYKQRIPDNIPAPHSFRLNDKTVQPFQRMLLPPLRCPFCRTSKEIEYSPYGSAVAMYIKFVPV
jgi:hypothetical protein